MTRLALVLVLFGLAGGCSTVPTHFAPTDPIPAARFSYQPFDTSLRAHVTEGQVNYPGFAADVRFAAYLGQLERVNLDEFKARADKLAFWINAYNALAIQSILAGDSPLTVTGKYRYFIKRTFTVGGGELNLWGLEHKLLIPWANRACTSPLSVPRGPVPNCNPRPIYRTRWTDSSMRRRATSSTIRSATVSTARKKRPISP